MLLQNPFTFSSLACTAVLAAVLPNDAQHEPTRITWFGERPAFSPNGSQIAFMDKSYGDAMSYELETGRISMLTRYPHAGYLRVQYLPNGDLLLIGARDFRDYATTRLEDQELWVLHPDSLEPVALGQKIWEGVAISHQDNRIAWANTHAQYPHEIEQNVTIVYQADVAYNETGYPRLVGKKELFRASLPDCEAEPQDFRNNDSELIYTCYRVTDDFRIADVRGFNLLNGEMTIYRNVSGEYNEVEGIYPGGEYITVESAHDQEDPDSNFAIEIWRMKLVPNSQDFVRLTWLSDTPGDKAGNPVVSPNGTMMAFSLGKAEDEPPGAGYGLYLLQL